MKKRRPPATIGLTALAGLALASPLSGRRPALAAEESPGPVSALAAPAAPAVTSGFAEVPGGRLFFEAAGAGPAIVMVHDGILHRETWEGQFLAFAADHRVVRYDRRGCGRSDPSGWPAPERRFSHVDDLLAVMKTAAVEKAAIVGCSAGGLISMGFALEHPEKVSALVLVGPIVSGLGFSEHFVFRGGRGMPPETSSASEKIRYWTEVDPWIVSPSSTAAKARMRALLDANPQNFGPGKQGGSFGSGPALRRLGEIKVPTLLVTGEGDIPDVHAHMGAIEAGIAGSKRIVLEGSGHLPHLEVPEAFNKAVLAFLGEVEKR